MTELSPEAVEVQAPPDLEFPELAPDAAEVDQYAGLTPLERAAAKTHPHISMCRLGWTRMDCVTCADELHQIRKYIPALALVIEADARADERRKAGAATEAAVALLADLVVKCTEYGSQDGGFVANYLLPTGPVHRAIPWLENRGVIVRPGFDGREPVAAASNPTDTRPEGE